MNARIRRAVKARGHFPNEQAALKCVYMAIMSLDPQGPGPLDHALEDRVERLRHHLSTADSQQPASNPTTLVHRLTDPLP
ncbi:hypothetical protein SGFS_002500 [Streptomyces graminofaciens]|uniref:Transposase n=1 Tax=Streptomyces graminofaciens TaxID=68212 RepID=A0ABN5V7N9_9ACTN|nr:hypothetical protein SGFS_002500 [Streptomyces graminofaciens]